MINYGLSDSYNVISKDYYTIQVVEDVAIYDAKIISSVGELITPGVLSTNLKLQVYQNLVDITNNFKKIVWKKFIYEGNTPVEQDGWGIDKQGKTEITITKDEYKKKVRIEAHVYGELQGKEAIVAGAYITLVDVNDLNPSTTPPENPKEGEVWLDTSITPPIFKVFLNGEWKVISDLDPIYKDIEELMKDIGKIDDKVLDLNEQMGISTLFNIDNKKDYLWDFNNSLTTTNALSPERGYKADIKEDGYFDNCVSVGPASNQILKYDKKVVDNTKDFVINMWIRPHSNLVIDNNQYRLISMGDIHNSFFNIYNASPIVANSSNKRFTVEFGNNDVNKQLVDLLHNDNFSSSKFEMFTIMYLAATKEFKFFRNGNFWTSKTIVKINPVNEFSIIRAGWDIDNLVVLNDKTYSLEEIKKVYEGNRPYRDLSPKITIAPSPENITMEIV